MNQFRLISLHIRSMWETICDAQAGFWLNSKFLPKFSRKPLSGISDQKVPPTKVYSGIHLPHFGKLQIWDDQSLLRNTPPISENFRFEMTKVYSRIPPLPHFGKLQIWDDQSLLQNNPPHFGKLQIWDDQSLLWNTPPPVVVLQSGRSYVETNLYPPWIPLVFIIYIYRDQWDDVFWIKKNAWNLIKLIFSTTKLAFGFNRCVIVTKYGCVYWRWSILYTTISLC